MSQARTAGLCGAERDSVGADLSDEGRAADAPDLCAGGDAGCMRGGEDTPGAGESEVFAEVVSFYSCRYREQHYTAGGAGAGAAVGGGAVFGGVGGDMSQPQRKRKVCCFCESWESGGIESFLCNVLQHLDLDKFQVDIVTSCLKSSIFTEPLQKIGVRFFELSGDQKKLIQNHHLFLDLIQKEQYDVVHLNVFHGLSLYYAKLAKKAGVPIRIAHSHNTALRASLTRQIKCFIHEIAKRFYSRDATDLWACSETAAKFLFSRKVLKEKGFRFIPNGIETEKFRFDPEVRESVRQELGLDGQFVIGNVGRLCYQKNQEFLLDIFAELKKQEPNSKLLFVGEGELEGVLKQKARQLGLEDSVIFYGISQRIEQLFWAMDVFVFPSRFEGLGIVTVEAQAAGLPVLCSETIPPEAIITDEVVQLKLSAEVKKWTEILLKMNQIERDTCSVKVSEAGFDIQVVAEKIESKWRDDELGTTENIHYCPYI